MYDFVQLNIQWIESDIFIALYLLLKTGALFSFSFFIVFLNRMILLFLIITTFFIPILCLLRCIGGPNCHIKLSFNQTVPNNKELLETCSIIETSSCSVYLRVDYTDQQVYISFEESSEDTESPHPSIDLLEANPQASIVLRYTVKIRIHNNNKFQLYILLQCRTNNQCSEKQLRHYWPRFISLNNRQNSFHSFSELLLPINSNIINCFDDRINQTVQCSIPDNICWASTNTQRKCTNHSNEFIYSYNKVERPHQLTDEYVHYTLACHVNNCNNNETIHRVRNKDI
jgi:hypothetical protein